MNKVNINNEEFTKTETYKKFMKENPGRGNLAIRAYAAGGAVPISNLTIEVSKTIDDNKVIFYEGITNESGIIEKISLPAPKKDTNDLNIPLSTSYQITATYLPNNTILSYSVNIYDNICVLQNISIIPEVIERNEI